MSEPQPIKVGRFGRRESGSCNHCQDRTVETVLVIDLRTTQVRLCDQCAANLVSEIWRVAMTPTGKPLPAPENTGDWEIRECKIWRCPDCGHRARTMTRHGAARSIDALIRRETGGAPLCRHKRLAEEMQNPDGSRSTFDDVDD